MLRRLFIKNIVLIESCEITFQPGFTVLTGETGAGKSMILSSLALLLGSRQDSSLIRQGASSALVEASFDIENHPAVFDLLIDAGVEHEKEQELIIKRDLSQSGKSRIYVNNSSVQLSFLKKLAPHLIEICAQHTHMELIEAERPLYLLDSFAGLHELRDQFQRAHSQATLLKKKIQEHKDGQGARLRQIETCRREIQEIEKAKLQEGEEEELFLEFSTFTEQGTLSQIIQEILSELDSERNSLLLGLIRQKPLIERLAELRPEFRPMYETYCHSTAEIKEIAYELTKASSRLMVPGATLAKIEARLEEIHALKKKYGSSVPEILEFKKTDEKRLQELESVDLSLEELEESLKAAQKEADTLALELSNKRRAATPLLSERVTQEIRLLNMTVALFEIELISQPRSSLGDESALFFLTPNRGETRINVQEAASGGELARIALTIHNILSSQRAHVTCVFDEIDANIGGQTAHIVGEKLAEMARSRQVIAITHFPQVAISADTHFRIVKEDTLERTYSQIELLDSPSQRKEELTRMLGGHQIETQFNMLKI